MQSNEINELADALVKAQILFPVIKKAKTANIPTKSGGSYSYSYADIGDINEAVNPILNGNGLTVVQEVTVHASGLPSLTTTLIHKSGQWKSSEMLLQIDNAGAQGQGSAITYARRYAKSALLDLVTESDDDGAAATEARQTPKPNAAVDPQTGQEDPRIEPILRAAQTSDNQVLKDIANKYTQYHNLSEKQLAYGFSLASQALSTPRSAPPREEIPWEDEPDRF